MNIEKRTQMEFDARLEEYKALKSEIVSNLESSRNISNLTFTATGALIAFTPFIISNDATILFLIAPIFFYGLAWSQLRYVYLVLDMGTYLYTVVVPGIQSIIASKKKNDRFSEIMSWELPGKNPVALRKNKLLKFLFLPIAGANYGIPLLTGLVSVATFIVLTLRNSQGFSALHFILLGINVLALIYSIFWGFQAEFRR